MSCYFSTETTFCSQDTRTFFLQNDDKMETTVIQWLALINPLVSHNTRSSNTCGFMEHHAVGGYSIVEFTNVLEYLELSIKNISIE
jgi:hypothetical protein